MQEGRRRRIAERALEGKKINTGRRRPKPELSPEGQRLVGLIRQLAEKQALRRKRGRPTNAEVLARFRVKSDEELIAKAREALLVLQHRWLGST
jgi:hypothetical protein